MIYKVDFEGQACKQIKEKAESYQYDLKSVLKGIGLLIADMWLPGDSKPQINTWEGLFEKVQEDYSYKDTIVENDFICSISNDDGISIIIEIADETIVDFKDIKSSILQVRDFLLANKWSGAIPDFLPIEQKEIRNMMNETERSIPFKCLHEAFFECAYRFPDKTALEWLSLDEKWETLSYEALKIKVLQTASMLKQEGVHTRDKVAIVLPKGENQIIAVLAILSIGATYVPIGIHQPLDRKKKIFEAGNISYALTDRDHINTLDGADTLRSFLIENSFRYVVMPETEIVKDIDSIAYIIFTSGTTGIPNDIIYRWIELLKKYNYVTETDGIYVCKIEIYEKGLKYGWEEVEYLWKGKLESPLVLDYIINNIKNWDKLIQKEQQATLLLFEQGEDIYADALYKETKILQYLNHSLSKKVLGYLYENANATILEIGAGTGATSDKVLSDIRENKFEEHIVYFYTDISRFFLQRAKERYKECDGKIEMHYQTLDIDEAFSSQLPSNFQADIVIAVGVLNNSVNTDKCIYEINSVMKPGGILLIIETVEDVPDILITQSFMMTEPKDQRKATNTMFLNRKQWLEILEENGFCNSEEFPGYGEYLEVLGQKLFYCTKE